MRILEIEKLFESEETLNEVLTKCKEDFETVDYYGGIMRNNVTNNPEEAKKALNILTGVYSNLITVLAIANTEKKNREIRNYDQLRIDTENENKKFVASVADKQASLSVAPYRRIRNIIQGYVDAAKTAVSSFQSLLKYMATERMGEGE